MYGFKKSYKYYIFITRSDVTVRTIGSQSSTLKHKNQGGIVNQVRSLGVVIIAVFMLYWDLDLGLAHSTGTAGRNFVHIEVTTKEQRTTLANLGMAIDSVKSDAVYGTANDATLARIRNVGFKIKETFVLNAKGLDALGFPEQDGRYHDYEEMTAALRTVVEENPEIMRMYSLGRTWQGRNIWAVQINAHGEFYDEGHQSGLPGIVFMGNHHAREHLSAEIPLMLIKYIGSNWRFDAEISRLVQNRDIFIIPMVNPDGVEYDISGSRYKMHRKNMRSNRNGGFFRRDCLGVDLNRNYGFAWGTGGSSTDPCSDVYKGPEPFSEPETQTIKAFVENRPNLKVLLSYHTFSELILYPWGHSYDPIPDKEAHRAYRNMAQAMAQWNHYTPQQSSELYIASGDTTDWSWGTLGIFSFTFELSPKNMWGGGGFYPGDEIIERVFADNLRPALFLMDIAEDPRRMANYENPLDDPMLWWLR
jgi:carboxypeptidase T